MNTKIPLRTTSTNTNLPKTERNESIYQDWISGQSRKNLIIKYRLSYTRIITIVKRQEVLSQKQTFPLKS